MELSPEDSSWSEDGEYVDILEKPMSGAQHAPSIWQAHCTTVSNKAGFKGGAPNAGVFYRPTWDVRVMAHGMISQHLETKTLWMRLLRDVTLVSSSVTNEGGGGAAPPASPTLR